ncbi:hypothetical protein [Pseudomonas baltica]|uniref:hypothetical protein n=1 Tax=Pseudomonas baltica TaxID=2762576 RepID=UPI00289707D5|nr:hypothetical protein [Pseudomonas baltica]
MNNSSLGQRLIALWQLLQRRESTFGEVMAMAAECGIDGRRVLADHFNQPAVIVCSLEA